MIEGIPGKVYVKYTCSDVRYRHQVSVVCEFNTLWHSDKVPEGYRAQWLCHINVVP